MSGFRSWPGALLCLVPGGVGAWLFFNAGKLGTQYEALGANLIGAAAVALAVFLVETHRDQTFGEFAQRHALLMQIALVRDLSGTDLSGRNLTGISFRNRKLRGANLEHALLTGVDLSFADLSGANLRQANLEGATLDSADLRLADFGHAHMSGASLVMADGRGASFAGAGMVGVAGLGANLSVLPAEEIDSLEFGAGRQGEHWRRSHLPRVNGDSGEPATLSGAKLMGSQWTGANFKGADLTKADFRYSALGATVFSDNHPGFWKFLWWVVTKDERWRAHGSPRVGFYRGVNWESAHFENADVAMAMFEGCTGPDLDFTHDQLARCRSSVDPQELK